MSDGNPTVDLLSLLKKWLPDPTGVVYAKIHYRGLRVFKTAQGALITVYDGEQSMKLDLDHELVEHLIKILQDTQTKERTK